MPTAEELAHAIYDAMVANGTGHLIQNSWSTRRTVIDGTFDMIKVAEEALSKLPGA